MLRCVLEWKHRSRVNNTHDWEGRVCADISIEQSQDNDAEKDNLINKDNEYANDDLFLDYSATFDKLDNVFESEDEPKSLPAIESSSYDVMNRQMDIPLTDEDIDLDDFISVETELHPDPEPEPTFQKVSTPQETSTPKFFESGIKRNGARRFCSHLFLLGIVHIMLINN